MIFFIIYILSNCFLKSKYQTIILQDKKKVNVIINYNKYNNYILISNSNYFNIGNIDTLFSCFMHILTSRRFATYSHTNGIELLKTPQLYKPHYFYDKIFNVCGYITYYNCVLTTNLDFFGCTTASYKRRIKLQININNSKLSFNDYYKKIKALNRTSYGNSFKYKLFNTNGILEHKVLFKSTKNYTKAIAQQYQYKSTQFPGLIYVIDGEYKHEYILRLLSFIGTKGLCKINTLSDLLFIGSSLNDDDDDEYVLVTDNVDDEKLYDRLDLVKYAEDKILIIFVDNYLTTINKHPKLLNYLTGYPMHF
jgi:hypothetical protein